MCVREGGGAPPGQLDDGHAPGVRHPPVLDVHQRTVDALRQAGAIGGVELGAVHLAVGPVRTAAGCGAGCTPTSVRECVSVDGGWVVWHGKEDVGGGRRKEHRGGHPPPQQLRELPFPTP